MRASLLLACSTMAACCAQDVVSTMPQDASGLPADASSTAPDATTTFADAMTGGNPDAEPTNGMDAGAPDSGPSMLACHVDRFAVCDDPAEAMRANEQQSDAFYINTTSVGCISGDQFMAGGFTHPSRMCPREGADWYTTNFTHCDTINFVAEVRLRPLTPCEPGALTLTVLGVDCMDRDVRCETNGTEQSVTWVVPPGNTVASWKFGVIRAATDVMIDYELIYALRR